LALRFNSNSPFVGIYSCFLEVSVVTVIEATLPREVVEMAKARGVDPKEPAEPVMKLLVL